MADFGFRRDIANSRLDIELAGNDVLNISSTQIILPARMTGGFEVADFGTVTQTTDWTTGVTLNNLAGTITCAADAATPGQDLSFTVTNSRVEATDIVSVAMSTPSTTGLIFPSVTNVSAGSFEITLSNLAATTHASLAVAVNFIVHKAAA